MIPLKRHGERLRRVVKRVTKVIATVPEVYSDDTQMLYDILNSINERHVDLESRENKCMAWKVASMKFDVDTKV